MVSLDRMKISILSVSIEALEMSCAEAAQAPVPQDNEEYDVWLQEAKFTLYSVLPFHHHFWGLSSLGLCELAVTCSLRLKLSLAHLDSL